MNTISLNCCSGAKYEGVVDSENHRGCMPVQGSPNEMHQLLLRRKTARRIGDVEWLMQIDARISVIQTKPEPKFKETFAKIAGIFSGNFFKNFLD